MSQAFHSRYEAICEASPDTILLVDDNGRITYANERVADMFGYEPAELLGDPVEVLVPASVRSIHAADREAYLDDPETRPMGAAMDLKGRRRDGSTMPVDISLSPIRTAGSLEVMAVVRDVSERETYQKTYRTILEAVPDAVLITDATTGKIVDANDEVATLLGDDPETLVGEPHTVVHPAADEARYRDLYTRRVPEDGAIFTQFPDGTDLCVERTDGDRVPIEINARVFELENQRLIVSVLRDVSSRKRRERRLRALHDTTRRLVEADDPSGIATLIADTADTILEYANTVVRFARDGRLRPASSTAAALSTMGVRPSYPIDDTTPAGRAYLTGEPIRIDDVRDIEDGHSRGDARAAMYLPMGEHGVVSVVDTAVGAFDRSDIELAAILATNAETALDRLAHERELERQNERLDEFAGVVSHDLRNPLDAARGWLDAVDRPESSENLRRVEDALDRMDAIIEDTLTLAKQGRAVGESDVVDVAAVARESWVVVATGEGRLEVADELRIRADRDRLQHLLENLFRNSVEHGSTDDDSGVTVTIGPVEGGFYVSDDGPGIPPEERDAVFEPGRTSSSDGTGLGLTIVDEIAEAHGWEVRVTDGDEGGARFEFTNVERS
ncbi:PAS domain S-box protein [Haloplanus salilacus]|uniref:PAS domain-containing sensor histidine kinase n=1 Tax=Haloplanus salilacus TaxID=2949994 RepID=UPI0030CBCE9C